MSDDVKINVVNNGKSAYGTSAGRLEPGGTLLLPELEAKRLIDTYPRFIVNSDTAVLNNDNSGLKVKISELNLKINTLQTENKILLDKIHLQEQEIVELHNFIFDKAKKEDIEVKE